MTKPATTNGFDPEKTKGFVSRVESLMSDIESERGTFMARCRSIRDDIKDILEEAKTAGIPKKALRNVIKVRELERKVEAVREDLDGEDQDSFDLIRHAIGDLNDTPLGDAALKKAKGMPGADAPGTATVN